MTATDRRALLIGLPGILLALAIGFYLAYAKTVCDQLYQPNRLLDLEFLAKIKSSVAAELGGSFSPPSREGLAFYRKPHLPIFCRSSR